MKYKYSRTSFKGWTHKLIILYNNSFGPKTYVLYTNNPTKDEVLKQVESGPVAVASYIGFYTKEHIENKTRRINKLIGLPL